MKNNVIVANFSSRSRIEEAVKASERIVMDEAEAIIQPETREEAFDRCMNKLHSLAGLTPDREELRDKKNDAHFKAKDRL